VCLLIDSNLQPAAWLARRQCGQEAQRYRAKKLVAITFDHGYGNGLMDTSLRNLQQAVSIRRQIDTLERRLDSLLGSSASGGMAGGGRRGGRRRMSAATRAKLAAAARARWARQRAGGRAGARLGRVGRRRRKGISAAGRRRLSQLMKARWAARRRAAGGRK